MAAGVVEVILLLIIFVDFGWGQMIPHIWAQIVPAIFSIIGIAVIAYVIIESQNET